MFGFLLLNLKQFKQTKTNAYNGMVILNLECWSTVWSPFNKDSKYKLEVIQHRAANHYNRY